MEDEEDVSSSIDYIYFYLWETSLEVFNIYSIAVHYLDDKYNLPQSILLALIADAKLPLAESLYQITYINDGYLNITLGELNSDNEDTKD